MEVACELVCPFSQRSSPVPASEEDSATINVDYKHIARTTNAIDVNNWTCIQGEGCTHTANVNVPILEDDKHERDEKFRYYLE